MPTVQRILVGVDFEAPSLAALDWAIGLAAPLGAQVVAMHALEIPVVGIPDGAFIATAEQAAALMAAAQESLDKLLASRRPTAPSITGMLRQGVAWETLHHVAEELGADLVVVGTHGRKGLMHALLGSVAEKAVRTAKRPIVVVHPRG